MSLLIGDIRHFNEWRSSRTPVAVFVSDMQALSCFVSVGHADFIVLCSRNTAVGQNVELYTLSSPNKKIHNRHEN